VIAAADIVGILRAHGLADPQAVQKWLDMEFSGEQQPDMLPTF
jgi:hypothetical protein